MSQQAALTYWCDGLRSLGESALRWTKSVMGMTAILLLKVPAMFDDPNTRTSGTLLVRLRSLDDHEAWNQFVERYTPIIYRWCRQFRLQDSDASDVTQEVLAKLVKAIRTFHYDSNRGNFRGWLKTVTHNAVRDYWDSNAKSARGSGDTQVGRMLAALQSPGAVEALSAALEAEAEKELLLEAEARVQLRVKPTAWAVYRLMASEPISALEVAKRLNIPVGEVYVSKSRVVSLLRKEVATLSGEPTPDDESS